LTDILYESVDILFLQRPGLIFILTLGLFNMQQKFSKKLIISDL